MKLIIKNKIISLGGGSTVTDEAGSPVYKVKGRVFSPTHLKKITDLEGHVLYKVRNKMLKFLFNKAYIKDDRGNKIAKVTNEGLLSFKTVDYEDNIVIKRNAYLDYDIIKNGDIVGAVRRNLDLLRDSFMLEINDNEDVAFFVALVIAMDNIRDNDRNG